MDKAREWVFQWTRDAHAMEEQAITMLEGQAGRLESYPRLEARIRQHLEETRQQAARLTEYLDRRDTDTSTLKDLGGKLTAMGQAMSGMFASDEVVKGSLASSTFEHMEIASYNILIAGAETIGDDDLLAVCRMNLEEEVAMAKWLEAETPDLTKLFLRRAIEGSGSAKR